jgi:hypothetical protein
VTSVAEDVTRLAIPVGQRIGAYHDSAEPDDHLYRIRVGTRVIRLPAADFRVWELAHGDPEWALDEPCTVARVVEAARAEGLDDAPTAIAMLVASDVLTTVGDGFEDRLEFGRRHRLVPTMLGLGNSAEEPAAFAIGLVGTPFVRVSALLYDLYEWGHLDASLWLACENTASVNRRLRVADEVATRSDLLLGAVVEQVHAAYLASGAAYLDRGRDGGDR